MATSKKSKAPKTSTPAKVEDVKIPTAPKVEVKVEKAPKPTIDTATVKAPKDVEVKVCKSAIIYIKGEVRAALKGRTLEVSNPANIKHANLTTFTKEEVVKRHLGSMNGLVRKIQDNKELESILTQLFN